MSRHAVVLALSVVGLTALTLLVRACGPGEPSKPPAPPATPAAPETKAPTPDTPPPPPAPDKAPEPKTPTPAPEAKSPTPPPPAAVDGPPGKIVGHVKLQGNRPRPKTVKMDADPKCAAMHADKVISDEMMIGQNNEVQWAFVYVSKGVKGGPFAAPKDPVLIDQVGCRYVPHVAGLMPGQPLRFRNSDDLLHNVHGLPFNNREWNIGQPSKGMESDVRLAAKEVMVKVKCDVHPWMGMWVGVLDHPYYSVTDAAGRFGIVNLPPGRYDVTVWHEGMTQQTKEVDVPREGTATADFLLQLK